MAEADLHYISATNAIAAFKARRLSLVELMAAVIDRAAPVNPKINAFTYTFFDRAMGQARAAEARYAKTDGQLRPLEGIPMVINDESAIKGERTTFGSPLVRRRQRVPRGSRLRARPALAGHARAAVRILGARR